VPDPTLARLASEVQDCTDCDLYRDATQAVFGEGPGDAALVVIGEQPGDREDRAGHPFVGPAGRVLDDALGESGLDRGRIYVTNAVKHFKWVRQGKVRLHKSPNAREVAACRQWWEREVDAIAPTGILCLGAVAAKAVVGPHARVTRDRGTFLPHARAAWVTMTVHPSSILRADDRDRTFAGFVTDLRRVREQLERPVEVGGDGSRPAGS
jgi:DNA polymerase